MKRIIAPIVFLVYALLLCLCVGAEVNTTKEPTAEKGMYIAGNPDLFPLEYYNERTERYEGILPEIYEKVSSETGLVFSYVGADSESRQKELAENLQVEIVSAYRKGEISVAAERELFTYEKDGKTYTVCIGFTDIADPEIVSKVSSALASADKNTWMSASMALKQQSEPHKLFWYLMGALGVLLIAVIVFIVYIVKKHKADQKQNAEKMNDSLTGIGNRLYFKNCYEHNISEEMRSLYYVGYISVNIEKLETYFGESKSEELQRYAASVITNSIGDNDFSARIGSGVFAVCCMFPDEKRAVKFAKELMEELNSGNHGSSVESGIVFRCGLYSLDKANIPYETAVFNARQGYLYAQSEKLDVCLSDGAILGRVSQKSRLQKKLSSAIEKDEFHLYLQFIMDSRTDKICGAEVLSRWHNPEEGVQSPANYIEDLKTAGMIEKLDLYILEKTCKLLHEWNGTELEGLRLSCNFTRITLSAESFLERFEELLERYSFDRQRLIIELTEDSLADDGAVAFKNVLGIKALGCIVALDDMGSGYTSFRDLCDYPIDIMKIDRHIVTKAADSRGYAVLSGIINMAHDLGISVLCEGVETETEETRVKGVGCDYIQGFLYSRVLPVENAIEFYKKTDK